MRKPPSDSLQWQFHSDALTGKAGVASMRSLLVWLPTGSCTPLTESYTLASATRRCASPRGRRDEAGVHGSVAFDGALLLFIYRLFTQRCRSDFEVHQAFARAAYAP